MIPDWSGKRVLILGAGPSAADIAGRYHDYDHVIVVNLSFRLIPKADILYGADSGFWHHYIDARSFAGVKIAPRDQRVTRYCPSVHEIIIPRNKHGNRITELIRQPIGHIGSGGGNGGFQALNIAVQTGATCIMLGGIDFTGEHWHGPHALQLRNPSIDQMQQWRQMFDAMAPVLRSWGVRVYNLSKRSTLKAYPLAL